MNIKEYLNDDNMYKLINSNISLSHLESIFPLENLSDSYSVKQLSSLKKVHDLYKKIVSENIKIEESILTRIKYINEYYENLVIDNKTLDERVKENKILTKEEIEKNLLKKTENMKKIDEKFLNTFSLNEEYKNEDILENYNSITAVSVITPIQTVSHFCESEDGILGKGTHPKEFEKIFELIKGHNIAKNSIIIRYIHSIYEDGTNLVMLINIPEKINSSQLLSLNNLNQEIKKFEEENNKLINISVGIKVNDNLLDRNGYNLDKILSELYINDDSIDYNEEYLVGNLNSESQFNSTFSLKDYNSNLKK